MPGRGIQETVKGSGIYFDVFGLNDPFQVSGTVDEPLLDYVFIKY